jgi:receptor expression-enhancing protein 5/6
MSEGGQESIFTKLINYIKEQGKLIEEKTGIPSKIVYIVLAICFISVIIGYLDVYITALVGIVIPSISSLRALQTKDSDDDKQWLTYWVVFGVFSFIDLFTASILKFIPFYFILKITFLIWLFMPNTKGALIIYTKIISKLFKKYEKQIDEIENQFQNNANKIMGGVQDNIPDKEKMNDLGNMANNLNSMNNLVNQK